MHYPFLNTYLGKVKKFQADVRALLRFIAKKPQGWHICPPHTALEQDIGQTKWVWAGTYVFRDYGPSRKWAK